MISAILSRLVILLFGTLYPAYASYKAVRTKNVKEYVKWMMYWIVFALFTCAETFTDVFLSFWFPFYYEIKIVLVIWLLSPATKGSSILYRNFVHPALTRREQEIDEYISKAKEQGYHTMLHLGSKGVTYATNVIMQTAIKGGGGIVNHLRRSYSLSDLSDDSDLKADLNRNSKLQGDNVDKADVPRDPRIRTSRKPGGSHVDLYFPEMDVDIRSSHHTHDLPVSLSQIRSSEDISSGYSSAEPLYGEGQVVPEGNPLMRTASVGAARARTRGSRTATQTKKAVTTEEEEDDLVMDYRWHQALPTIPVTSLFPELLNLDPSQIPSQAFLSPEALQLIYTNSVYTKHDPHKIHDINEEQQNKVDNLENIKTAESFEDAEQEILLENSNSITEPNKVNMCEDNDNIVEVNLVNYKPNPPSPVTMSVENIVEEIPKNASIEALINPATLVSEQLNLKNVTNQLLEENCKDDLEENAECFEDASDIEVFKTTKQDGNILVLDTQHKPDNTENKTLKETGSMESIASSGDQCFEDSLPDVPMVIGDESPNIKDRKGKYNKIRAPPPPDLKNSEEEGITQAYITVTAQDSNIATGMDLLLDSTIKAQRAYPDKSNIENLLEESKVEGVEVQRTTYNKTEISPTPTKKENSNLSRFLPKTAVSSLLNFWVPNNEKLEGNKSNTDISPTNIIKNTDTTYDPYPLENKESTSRFNPKLKIRQMSQSPSRRKHYFD